MRVVTARNGVHRESKICLRNRLKCARGEREREREIFARQFAFRRSDCFWKKIFFPYLPLSLVQPLLFVCVYFRKINALRARRKPVETFLRSNSHVSARRVCNLNVTRTQRSLAISCAATPATRPRCARPAADTYLITSIIHGDTKN